MHTYRDRMMKMYLLLLVVLLTISSNHIQCFKHSIGRFTFHKSLHTLQATSVSTDDATTDVYPLFVGNLPFSYTKDQLKQLANEYGISSDIIQDVRIVCHKRTGESRGFGYIDFNNRDDVTKSMKLLENVQVSDRLIKLDIAETITSSPSKGRRAPLTSDDYSIFVGNVPFDLSNVELQDFITDSLSTVDTPYKGMIKARIAYSSDDRSKGFAHVDFITNEEADAAIEVLQGKELVLKDRVVNVDRSVGKKPIITATRTSRRTIIKNSKTIFIGNLSFQMDEANIRAMIDDIVGKGIVRRVFVSADLATKKLKGFCHVDFDTPELANAAVSKINGLECYGRVLRADLAENKNEFPQKEEEA